MTDLIAAARVRAARTALVLDQPFFGVLALHLALVEDINCRTAWTDGVRLGYSPSFVQSLPFDQLTGLIAHEVMHCACGHPWRRDSREPERWNAAADYVINGALQASGFTLPQGALLDAAFTGRHAEYVYDRLPATPPQSQPGEVRDAPADDAADGSTPSDSATNQGGSDSTQRQMSAADWQQLAEQVKLTSAGSLPGDARRALGELFAPIVDWRSVLRRFVQQQCAADYSWSAPNPRYIASGLYLPSLKSYQCGPLVVAIDTSGSVDSVMLQQFGAELSAIVAGIRPSTTTVIYCDARVQHVDTFMPDDIVSVSPHGGGGTRFQPVFDRVAVDDLQPAALVYLTDLEGPAPTMPDYPVLWAVTGSHAEPFGERVQL